MVPLTTSCADWPARTDGGTTFPVQATRFGGPATAQVTEIKARNRLGARFNIVMVATNLCNARTYRIVPTAR